ncbi:MAG: universal stress protein [Alphaproteobacteria bacterium]|nr:universal stress protein [Alphaproteobacteria bacterium]
MRMLLALDVNDEAGPLIETAVKWCERLGATLDLAYAETYPFGLSVADDPTLYAEFERQWEIVQQKHGEAAKAALQRVPEGVRGRVHGLVGAPDDALVERSGEYDALILATHGRHGLRRLWEGSVSERVVRRAECPVLVLRHDDPAPPGTGRVILGVDVEHGTPDAALKGAARWARLLGTRVDLVYIDPFQHARVLEHPAPPESWLKHLEQQRLEALDALAAKLPDDIRGEKLYRAGNAGAAISPITELAEAREAALLAVCTHGRSGLQRLLLGSVAERVVRSATVPVLVLRR